MKKIFIIVILIVIGITSFSGCLAEEGAGILILQLTDAPGDIKIEKALVTIKRVEVHMSGEGSDENEPSAGWYTVTNEHKEFDLITLKDTKEFLGKAYLKEGLYNQIRLYVDEAELIIDGDTYNLKIPSQEIKLINKFKIEDREYTTLTLDFDIQKSVKSTGSGKYILNPTIKVIQE